MLAFEVTEESQKEAGYGLYLSLLQFIVYNNDCVDWIVHNYNFDTIMWYHNMY